MALYLGAHAQERRAKLTTKTIRQKTPIIVDLAHFMIESKTTRLIYDSLDDGDVLKRKMKKVGVDYIKLRYLKDDFDPGDSTVRFDIELTNLRRYCAENIFYDFSQIRKNYGRVKKDDQEFIQVSDRVYYQKNCKGCIRP